MAAITAAGYSFIDDTFEDPGFTTETEESRRSYDVLDRGWSLEFTGIILNIWQNPIFINAYCPVIPSTRPTTGQVYPRGYN